MTSTDVTRIKRNAYKRQISSSVAHLTYADVVSTNTMDLFNIPANALIINAGVVVKTVANGAITVAYGIAGGSDFGAALDVHTATGYVGATTAIALTSGALTGTLTSGLVSGATTVVQNLAITGTVTTLTGTQTPAPRIDSGTGALITAIFSAGPTAGDFYFICEYIEYTLVTGDMTNYVTG